VRCVCSSDCHSSSRHINCVLFVLSHFFNISTRNLQSVDFMSIIAYSLTVSRCTPFACHAPVAYYASIYMKAGKADVQHLKCLSMNISNLFVQSLVIRVSSTSQFAKFSNFILLFHIGLPNMLDMFHNNGTRGR